MSDVPIPDNTQAETSVIQHEQVEMPRVGFLFILFYFLASFAVWMSIFPVLQVLIPQQIQTLDAANKIVYYSAISTLGTLLTIISFPLTGILSDRINSRFGKRRLWLLIGGAGTIVSLLILANAVTIPLLFLGWCISSLFASMALAAMFTAFPDQVPPSQRGTVSGIVGLSIPIAIAVGAILSSRIQLNAYYVFSVLILVFVLLFATQIHTNESKGQVADRSMSRGGAAFLGPFSHASFTWAWFSLLALALGYSLLFGYLLYYIQDGLHYQRLFPGQPVSQGVSAFQSTWALCLILSAAASGFLSDRLRRRKIFVVVAGFVMAVALALLATIPSNWSLVLLAAAIFGLGYGIYQAVDLALVSLVLPARRSHGRDMGIINLAGTFPQALAPLIAGFIIGTSGSYIFLLGLAAVSAIVGALLVTRVQGVK